MMVMVTVAFATVRLLCPSYKSIVSRSHRAPSSNQEGDAAAQKGFPLMAEVPGLRCSPGWTRNRHLDSISLSVTKIRRNLDPNQIQMSPEFEASRLDTGGMVVRAEGIGTVIGMVNHWFIDCIASGWH